jgi:hypothetical protein
MVNQVYGTVCFTYWPESFMEFACLGTAWGLGMKFLIQWLDVDQIPSLFIVLDSSSFAHCT